MENLTKILKNHSKINNLQLTLCVIGSRRIGPEDSIEQQGWNIFAPNLRIIGFEPDQDSCDELNNESRNFNWAEEHFPLALGEKDDVVPFYETLDPACSSLYQPDESLLNRFGLANLAGLKDIKSLAVISLDQFCDFNDIKVIDVIQVDAQGADLDILKGSIVSLENCLAVRTEVEFSPLYHHQPLFSDVDVFLRKNGFTLFDLWTKNIVRRISPLQGFAHEGQLLWGDAFYLRDLLSDNIHPKYKSSPDLYLKMACIADTLGFVDYSLELLVHLTLVYGHSHPNYNCADEIIVALSQLPELVKQGLSTLELVHLIQPFISTDCRTQFNI